MQPEAFWDVGGYCFWPFDARLARYLTVFNMPLQSMKPGAAFKLGFFGRVEKR